MSTDAKTAKARLRIGAVGHRPTHALSAKLSETLGATFRAIEKIAEARMLDVTLLTGLAEGADTLAARARPKRWSLGAVLPFKTEEYAKDFATSAWKDGRDAVAEFEALKAACDRVVELDTPRDDNTAYERAGLYLLRNVDLLVAVWDGHGERGAGGTGALVPAAAEFGIPIVWIESEGDGAHKFIRGRRHDGGLAIQDDPLEIVLADAIAQIVDLPEADHKGQEHAGAPVRSNREKHEDFVAERWRSQGGLPYFSWFSALMGLKRPLARRVLSAPEERPDAWRAFLDEAPEAGGLRKDIETRLLPAYLKADGLAVHFANNYRSAYIVTYALSFLAVLLALAGLILPHEWSEEALVDAKTVLVLFELAAIIAILRIVKRGGEERWHERWLDYRALAEMLRHIRFLAYIGEHRQLGHEAARSGAERSLHWTVRYARDVARSIGLPQATIDKNYLSRLLGVVDEQELEKQLKYHRDAERSLNAMHERLHHAGEWCFRITLWVLAAFAALALLDFVFGGIFPKTEVEGHEGHGEPLGALTHWLFLVKAYVGFAAAALPTLGAALSGIRFTGEFETVAARSRAMIGALKDLRAKVTGLQSGATFDATAETLVDVAGIMAADIETFQTLYGYKRLTLPG